MKRIDAIILSCFGYELTSDEKNFFKNIYPFGFILFKRNFKNKEQIKKDNFRIQFASFREKQKSLEISSELKEKMSKMSIEINLIVKEVKIKENQIYYRVISESKYPFGKANSECAKFKKNKIPCIIIKS